MRPPIVTDPLAHANLRKTIEVILADVDAWDQSFWGALVRPLVVPGAAPTCRTAFCVAGHYAVTVAGYRPVWAGDRFPARRTGDVVMLDYVTDAPPGTEVSPDRRFSPSLVAAEAFGLTPDRADQLFRATNSLRRVLDLAYAYTGGAVDLYAAYEDVLDRHPTLRERELAAEDDDRRTALVAYHDALRLCGGYVDLAARTLTGGAYPRPGAL